MRTIAVLGANGFIGSRAVEIFHLGLAAHVRPIVRAPSSLARLSRFDLDARVADARDEQALTAAFEGCEAVIHAAAGEPSMIASSARSVYRAAERAGVRRLIYLSSASVHGQSPSPGTDETTPLRRLQPLSYNTAKIDAENALRRLRDRGRVELVLLRPGIVYGPRSAWIGSFADGLLAGSAFLVRGGSGTCNAIYVDNLVHAIDLAVHARGADGEAFLCGDRERVTWRDLYAPFAAALGFDVDRLPSVEPVERSAWQERSRHLARSTRAGALTSRLPKRLRRLAASSMSPLRPANPRSSPFGSGSVEPPAPTLEMSLLQTCRYKLPHSKAERLLGYVPPIRFEEGCRRTVAWLRFAGYPVEDPASREDDYAI